MCFEAVLIVGAVVKGYFYCKFGVLVSFGPVSPTHHVLHMENFRSVRLYFRVAESVFSPLVVVTLVDDLEGPMFGYYSHRAQVDLPCSQCLWSLP